MIDDDELIEHWTLVGDELAEVAGKRGPTRLAFALLLTFYTGRGRFPRGRGELPDEAVAYVARQVKIPAADLGLYEWSGRTFGYHRAQIRAFLGFRECTVADTEKLTAWLAEHVCCKERRAEGSASCSSSTAGPSGSSSQPPAGPAGSLAPRCGRQSRR